MDHVDQYSQTQPEHPSRPPPELEIDFWCRAVGGVQKGRAYGLGPRNNLSRLRSGLRGEGSSRQAEGVDDVQVAAMAQQIAELNRKLAETEARRVEESNTMKANIELLMAQVKSHIACGRFGVPPSPPPSDPEDDDDGDFVARTPDDQL